MRHPGDREPSTLAVTCAWDLKGEGNASAVFAPSRPASCSLRYQVLRVKKRSAREASSEELEIKIWSGIPELVSTDGLIRGDEFASVVIWPLLGEHLRAQQVPVNLPKELQQSLLEVLQAKGRQPTTQALETKACLLQDLTLLPADATASPTFCVEIKPKCGFLPSAKTIHPRNALKKQTTRFRLHQALKQAQGAIKVTSSYDPLDLYSGDTGRMQRALLELLATPQNNLRLFVDGKAVEKFAELEQPFAEALGLGESQEAFAQLLTHILQDSGVLGRLLAIQRQDEFDIEGVYALYRKLRGQAPHDLAANLAPGSVSESAAGELGEYKRAMAALLRKGQEKAFAIVRGYLTAAAAKDCSVMIAFRRRPSRGLTDGCQAVVFRGMSLESRLAVVDLDIKPLSKLHSHWELDREIMQANR